MSEETPDVVFNNDDDSAEESVESSADDRAEEVLPETETNPIADEQVPEQGDTTMDEQLKAFGLNDDQIAKLKAEGATSTSDVGLSSVEELVEITGCGRITARKVLAAFAPTHHVPTPGVLPTPTTDPETGEASAPTANEVKTFASNMGIDPAMLTAFMFAGMGGGGAGMDLDLSSMLPIPQIVMAYSPKRKDMPYMVMGQVERRLGTPIVVINSNGAVNPTETVNYIMSLEEGFEPAENGIYYDDSGTPHEIIKVGMDAQGIYDSDPLQPEQALRQNGMGLGQVLWNEVGLDVRQVVFYAATQTNELSPTNEAHLTWLRDNINPATRRLDLNRQCPLAIGLYNQAARTGSLPTLRVQLSRTARRREVMPRRRQHTVTIRDPRHVTPPDFRQEGAVRDPGRRAGLGVTQEDLYRDDL